MLFFVFYQHLNVGKYCKWVS